MIESIRHWGIIVIVTLQGLGEWLIAPMNAFTFTGNLGFFLLILPALYWCYNRRLGIRVTMAVLLGAALSVLLKTGLHGPRPYWFDPQVLLWSTPETTFGLPSAHAEGAVVFWGLLAAHFRKRWMWALALALILLVSVSRIVVGVHFPTDVIVGWIVGSIVLWLVVSHEDAFMGWFNQQSKPSQGLFLVTLSFALVVLGILVSQAIQATWQLPDEWLHLATQAAPDVALNPFSLEVIVASAGFIFGLAYSVFYLETDFHPEGAWYVRLARYLVGIIVLFLIWKGLDSLFAMIAADDTLLGYVLRYIRYGVISAWIWGFAPKLFLRLGLTEHVNTA